MESFFVMLKMLKHTGGMGERERYILTNFARIFLNKNAL